MAQTLEEKRAYKLEYYYKNRDKKQKYMQQYYQNNKEERKLYRQKIKEKVNAYLREPKNRAKRRESRKRYRKNHPDRQRAHSLYTYAVKHGKLERQPCGICGSIKNIHGHHPDYSKPLEVIWLCRTHHYAEHERLKIN